MRRPSRIALTIEPKSSSSSTIGRRFARDIGAAAAHRDADMRRLQRGRIVDAVAGHRDDLAIGLAAR